MEMNEYAICSLQASNPERFQELINRMVLQGYQVDGPISVFPFFESDRITQQPKPMTFFFMVLMKRPIVNFPKT
jgi:hypothetical protein